MGYGVSRRELQPCNILYILGVKEHHYPVRPPHHNATFVTAQTQRLAVQELVVTETKQVLVL